MKKIYSYTLLIALIGVLSSCLGLREKSYDDAMDKNRDRLSENQDLLSDAEFLVEMKSFGLLMQAVTDTAKSQAYARKVSEFAREVSDKQKYYLEDLDKLADDKDIVLPDVMSAEHRGYLDDLLDAEEDEFDKEFLTLVENLLERKIRSTERMATEAHDDDVRAWTARQIKMMKNFEERADEMEDELLTTG